MRITFLQNGRTVEKYLREGVAEYETRIGHYLPYTSLVLPAPKNAGNPSPEEQKRMEWERMRPHFEKADCVVLLDERGTEYSSVKFAGFLQQKMNSGTRHLMFVVGGPYGFAPEAYAAAHAKISLSLMTFSHQMVRLFFTEQIYRALTIINRHPYHNE